MLNLNNLKEHLKLSTNETIEFYYTLSSTPSLYRILLLSEKEFEERVSYFENELEFSKTEILELPILLTYDVSLSQEQDPYGIRANVQYYKEELGFSNANLKDYPTLLTLDTTSSPDINPFGIQARVKFLRENLNFSNKQLKAFPMILGLDCTRSAQQNPKGARAKINELRNILGENEANELIKNNPIILFTPSNSIESKYALAVCALGNSNFLNNSQWLTINEEKIYARYRYLNENGKDINPTNLYSSEKRFQDQFSVSSEELMKKYPYSVKIKKAILNKYKQIQQELSNEQIE